MSKNLGEVMYLEKGLFKGIKKIRVTVDLIESIHGDLKEIMKAYNCSKDDAIALAIAQFR